MQPAAPDEYLTWGRLEQEHRNRFAERAQLLCEGIAQRSNTRPSFAPTEA